MSKGILGVFLISSMLCPLLSGCMIDGVCVGSKATCDKEKKDGGTGSTTSSTGGFSTAADGCTNAGDILGNWVSTSGETLKFGKDCTFASSRNGCVRAGHYGIPQSKGAALGLSEAEAVAQSTNGVSTFKISIAATGSASTDEYCPALNTTLSCDFTIEGNDLSMTGCSVPTTVNKFYQKDYKRNN